MEKELERLEHTLEQDVKEIEKELTKEPSGFGMAFGGEQQDTSVICPNSTATQIFRKETWRQSHADRTLA